MYCGFNTSYCYGYVMVKAEREREREIATYVGFDSHWRHMGVGYPFI